MRTPESVWLRRSTPALRANVWTRVLDAIIAQRGESRSILCDNGTRTETSRRFLAWSIERKIELVHIQPGKPTQNAHVESFHGRSEKVSASELVPELIRRQKKDR